MNLFFFLFNRSVVSNFLDPMDCNWLLCPWISSGKNTGVGCHPLYQGIFLTQVSNPNLPHDRQILYPLSHHEERKTHTNLYLYVCVYIYIHTHIYITIYTCCSIIKDSTKKKLYIYVFFFKSHETLAKSLISPILINTAVYKESLFIIP